MNKDILILLSGGADSLTLLHKAHKDGYNVVACLTFEYGQIWKNELKYVKKQIKDFNIKYNKKVEHIIYKINFNQIGNSLLLKHLIHGRNVVFLSIAGGIAATLNAENIGMAATCTLDYDDGGKRVKFTYPDCSLNFIKKMQDTFNVAFETKINLYTPFAELMKQDVIKEGLKLGVNYKDSWTCMENGKESCMKCESCKARTEAFILNWEKDPAIKDWNKALYYYMEVDKIDK